MTPRDPCPLHYGGGMGQWSPHRRGPCRYPAVANHVTGRPAGLRAATSAKDASRDALLRCRSGFPGLAIMSGHRGNMGSHSPGCKRRVLVTDGKVDAGVLAEFPLTEALEVLIQARAAFEHWLPQGPHH